jgi:hypothetical protein
LGFSGLIGLIGDIGLFRFVTDITQESDVVDHAVQVGEEYASEQIEERVCVVVPVYPA